MNLIKTGWDTPRRIVSAIRTLIAGHGTLSKTFRIWIINSETGLNHFMKSKSRVVGLSSSRKGVEFTPKSELYWPNWIQDKAFLILLVMGILEERTEKKSMYETIWLQDDKCTRWWSWEHTSSEGKRPSSPQ